MRSMFFFTVIGIKITHPILIMRNKTNKCTYKYVNLLYYKQLILLHVSATYCGLLQGGVLWRMYYLERQNNVIYSYKPLHHHLRLDGVTIYTEYQQAT